MENIHEVYRLSQWVRRFAAKIEGLNLNSGPITEDKKYDSLS